MLFSSCRMGKTLGEEEINAVCEYLQKQVKAFSNSRLRKRVLVDLIKKSEVKEFNSENRG